MAACTQEMNPWPAVLTNRIPLDLSLQRVHLPAQLAPAVQSRQQVITQTELNLQTSPCSCHVHCAQHQLHGAILSLLPYTVCRVSRAGCELLPCSSQGCRVAGWEAAEPSASPHFAWPAWRPVAALCDGQGCSALKLLSEHNQ